MNKIPPALTLFLLSPLLGELISGHLSPLEFFHPFRFIITVVPYGCGALICREIVVRNQKGFLNLILIGIAFGLFFEGLITRVIFNPNWEGLGGLSSYDRLFGMNLILTVGIVHFHTFISIISAIFLTEILYPEKKTETWISKPVLALCFIGLISWIFLFGIIVSYNPPIEGIVFIICLCTVLIVLTIKIPAKIFSDDKENKIHSVIFWLLGFLAMTSIMIGVYVLPQEGVQIPTELYLFLLILIIITEIILLIYLTKNGKNWSDNNCFYLIIGWLTFFLFITAAQLFTGKSIVSFITIILFIRLKKKLNQRELNSEDHSSNNMI
ncbi:MAG: hypothetical protein ACFFDK_06790 [Promethearchaeota archaeon]